MKSATSKPLAVLGLLAGIIGSAGFAQAQTITQQPQSRTNAVGTTATFAVTVADVGPLTYRWQFDGTNLTDGGSISGAVSPNLIIANVQSNRIGIYSVIVSNASSGGSLMSSNAFLFVFTPPAGGTVDTAFTIPGALNGVNQPVWSIVTQPDGWVLVGGEFTIATGAPRNWLMRLENNGSLDVSFLPTNNSYVGAIVRQRDGKVVVAGGFTMVNGVVMNHLARLNTNGTLDATFQNGLVAAQGLPEGAVGGIALQPDDKLIIGGYFSSVHGVPRKSIARLHADGTLDSAFQNGMKGVSGRVNPVLVQPDGKVLIAGNFARVNGAMRNGVARLNADGSLDETFMNGLGGTEAGATVYCMALQPDGKVLIGGTFRRVNGWSCSHIARLNPDGSSDAFFDGEANSYVHALALQADGRIVLGGQFSAVNNVARSLVARLEPDGALDATFQVSVSGGMHPKVATIALDGGWKVFIGGDFTSAGGQPASSLARLWSGPPRFAPTILNQPVSLDLASGLTANFAVSAAGETPLFYQWRRNSTDLLNGGRVAGAINSTLTISNVQGADAGDFTVVVSNLWGAITSTPVAVLTVDHAPMIVAPPQSQSSLPSSNASFTVFVSGHSPITFQWCKDGVPLSDGGRFWGVHDSTFTIAGLAASDAGQYHVLASNAWGSTNSLPATLHVSPCRLLGNIPSSQGAARRVVVTGNLAYVANTKDTFRTSFGSLNIVDVSDPTNLVRVGAFNVNSDINAVAVAGNRAYLARGYAEPLGLSILDISNPAAPTLLGYYGSYYVTGHGTDVAVVGSRAYLAAGASLRVFDVSIPATPMLLGGWTNIYGSEEVSVAGDFAYFGSSGLHVINISNPTSCVRVGGATGPSSGVTLAGNLLYLSSGQGFRIYDVSNPSNVVLRANNYLGNILDFTIVGNVGYAASGDDGLRLLDLTDPINPVLMGDCATKGFAQGVAVTGSLAYVADGDAGLSVFSLGQNVTPQLLTQPQSQTAFTGTPVLFSAIADGTPALRYQWLQDDLPLAGATNAMLWLTNVQPVQAGYYSVVVTNNYGSVTSSIAALAVIGPPQLAISWGNGLPLLDLTGTAGFAYALEHAPELPWSGTWLNLTNVTLTSDPWRGIDTSIASTQQRYYRARQLNFAPDSFAGKTVVATVTNAGPFVVTLVFAAHTVTETNGGDVQTGTYSYSRTSPVMAMLNEWLTSPPDVAGDASQTQLTFTSPAGGTFVSISYSDPGDLPETALGTFQISDTP